MAQGMRWLPPAAALGLVLLATPSAVLAARAPALAPSTPTGVGAAAPGEQPASGGQADPAGLTGASSDAGDGSGGASADAANVRPAVGEFSVPARATAGGRLPRIVVRIDEPGVHSVHARVVLIPFGHHRSPVRIDLHTIPTGRRIVVRWPGGATLARGRYRVRLHAYDANGHTLIRRAHASGRAVLTVVASRRPVPHPLPAPHGALAPAPLPAGGRGEGVFPVAGPHTYGDRFGVPRPGGRRHKGQDIPAAEGTPVVAPVSGSIITTASQPSAAGYYVAEHGSDGRDYFFAHCQSGSFAVEAGQAVSAGQGLCRIGHTGDASGPHLHFEIWVGGWHAAGGHAIDPLPDLRAWDR
jgi:biotin carboxyl carrier protein